MANNKLYYVYLMTNKNNTVLYTGVTHSLLKRSFEHRSNTNKDCFTAKYNICKLVYYETFSSPVEAIAVEKKIKTWKREWKNNLIGRNNPGWNDLFDEMELD